jgi:integrase
MADGKGGLTDAVVRSLKAELGERLVRLDAGRGAERGLEMRVTAKGVKSWSIRYRRPSDGTQVRLKLGTFPAMSLEAARKECRAVRNSLDKQQDPAIDREKRKSADTFRKLAEDYLDLYAKAKRSRGETKRILEREWYPAIGAMKAGEVQRLTIRKVLEDIAVKREAPVAANRALAAVRGVFNWAVDTGRLERTPIVKMKRLGEEEARTRYLNLDELRQLWTALPGLPVTDDIRDIVRLCLITGQRVGEVAGLRKSEVNSDGKMWTLPKDRTKNGVAHSVPLSDAALAIIEPRMKGRGQFLFPSRLTDSEPVLASAPNKALQRNMLKIGIPAFTVHDLRRTVNTHMARLGVNAETRSRVLNHISAKKASITEAVYNSHNYDLEKRKALEAWAHELLAIVSAVPLQSRNIIKMMATQ